MSRFVLDTAAAFVSYWTRAGKPGQEAQPKGQIATCRPIPAPAEPAQMCQDHTVSCSHGQRAQTHPGTHSMRAAHVCTPCFLYRTSGLLWGLYLDYFILIHEINLCHSPPNRTASLLTQAMSKKISFLTGSENSDSNSSQDKSQPQSTLAHQQLLEPGVDPNL